LEYMGKWSLSDSNRSENQGASLVATPSSPRPLNSEQFTRDCSGLILTLPRGFPRKRMSAPFIKLTQNGRGGEFRNLNLSDVNRLHHLRAAPPIKMLKN